MLGAFPGNWRPYFSNQTRPRCRSPGRGPGGGERRARQLRNLTLRPLSWSDCSFSRPRLTPLLRGRPWPLQGFLLPTRVRREFGFEGHEPPPFLFQPFSLYPLKPTSMLDCPRRGRTRGRVFRVGRIPRSAWMASPRRQSSPSSTIRCLRIMLKHVCCSRSVDLSRAHADGRAHTRTRSRTRSHTERATRLSAGCLWRFRFKGSILSLRSGPEHRSVMASFRSHHC